MSALFALCLTTAVLCGLWSWIAGTVGLLAWAGFAGCTTYFACGSHGAKGVKKTIMTNMAGVACGMMIIGLSSIIPKLGEIGVWCAVITFVMCLLSKYKWFDFCPGIFMGCFVTFAAGGDWKGIIVALIFGAALGAACDLGSGWLCRMTNQQRKKEEYSK